MSLFSLVSYFSHGFSGLCSPLFHIFHMDFQVSSSTREMCRPIVYKCIQVQGFQIKASSLQPAVLQGTRECTTTTCSLKWFIGRDFFASTVYRGSGLLYSNAFHVETLARRFSSQMHVCRNKSRYGKKQCICRCIIVKNTRQMHQLNLYNYFRISLLFQGSWPSELVIH